MNSKDTYDFDRLKELVFDTLSKTHSGPTSFEKFGKEDIVAFQEALFDTVKTKVSEKWFYTYFKNSSEKLPRIDMLNLLSQYVGYQNWNEFRSVHRKSYIQKRRILWLCLLVLVIVIGIMFLPQNHEYHFCFVDGWLGVGDT